MESEHSIDRDTWLTYINRLIDRKLNSQRISGFTTWAIAGVIAILLLKILADIPAITTNKSAAALHLTAVTGVINILVFLYGLLSLTLSIRLKSAIPRFQSRMQRIFSPIISLTSYIAIIVLCFLNLVTLPAVPKQIQSWPFLVIGLFSFMLPLPYSISRVCYWIKGRKRHLPDLPALSFSIDNLKPHKRFRFYAIAGISSFIGLCIALVPAIQSLPYITTQVHVNTLIWSIYVAGIFFLSLIIASIQLNLSQGQYFVELEQRIIIEALTSDVIRSEFIKEVIGEDFRDWVATAEREMMYLQDEFEQAVLKTEEQFAELNRVNNRMKFEIAERQKICKNGSMKAFANYIHYSRELFDQTGNIICSPIPHEALSPLKQMTASWQHTCDSILDRQNAICNNCRNASSENQDDVKKCKLYSDIFIESVDAKNKRYYP